MSTHQIPEKAGVDLQQAEEANEIKPIGTVDTVHNDEAVKILDTYAGDCSWTEEEEKKLRRKIDWRLMPILCMTYGLVYYDKAMLSQAVSLFPNDVQILGSTDVHRQGSVS